MTETLRLEQTETGIATITFNRPQALNALNMAAMTAFSTAVADLSAWDDLRVVILRGAGQRAFCSGGDLVELRAKPHADEARAFIALMGDALLALEQLPVPVIAAVNGYALGGGSEIALACDMRIIDAAARMGMVQINMAVTPGWGAGQRLLRMVGYSTAMRLLLTGKILQADDAFALGLADEIVPQGTAHDAALAFADNIAGRPPQVVRGIKQLLQAGRTQRYHDALTTEREIFPPLWADDPHLQAVEAFFQRQQQKRGDS